MSTLHSTLDSMMYHTSTGFDFAPSNWGMADDPMTGLAYPSDVYLDDPSYDFFAGTFTGVNAPIDDSISLSLARNPCGGLPTSPLEAPASFGQFSGAEGFISSSQAGISDTDSDCFERGFFSPTSSSSTSGSASTDGKKRSVAQSSADGSGFYITPNLTDPDSPPPLKRVCSEVSAAAAAAAVVKLEQRTPAPREPRLSTGKAVSSSQPRIAAIDSKSKPSSAALKVVTKTPSSPRTTGTTGTSGSGGNHKVHLRTAARKNKSAKSPGSTSSGGSDGGAFEQVDDDMLTTEERRARQSHNMVEKQYRNRLNSQFERLLAVLPADQRMQNGGSGGGGDDDDDVDGEAAADRQSNSNKAGSSVVAETADDRRMSKAEVLDMARRRIRVLEQERRKLRRERDGLVNNVDALRGAIAQQGKRASRV